MQAKEFVEGELLPKINNKLTPQPFQIAALQEFIENNYQYGLFDETGTGKTISIFLILLYVIKVKGWKVCLVTKGGLFTQLKQDFKNFYNDRTVDIRTIKTKKQIENGFRDNPDICLITHHGFKNKQINKLVRGRCFIIDEMHIIRNPTGLIYDYMRLAYTNKRVLMATGTPLYTDVRNLYPILRMLGVYGKGYASFKRDFCVFDTMQLPSMQRPVKKFKESKNLSEAVEMLYVKGRRMTKFGAWGFTDEPLFNIINLAMGRTQRSMYNALIDDSIFYDDSTDELHEIDEQAYAPLIKAISTPELYDSTASSPIKDSLENVLDNLGDSKLIVTFMYTASLQNYLEWFESKGYKCARVSGSLSESDKFKNDPECKILLANTTKVAEGFNFQHVCSRIFMVEYNPLSGMIAQLIDRVFRIGQTEVVNVHIPRVANSLYAKGLKTLAKRSEDFLATVDSVPMKKLLKEIQ